MSVGIHTNADSTVGYGSAIYMNPACPFVQLETEIDGKSFQYVGFGICSDASISTFIDLKSATVNDELNSQYLPIAPGTYKHSAISFCQGGAHSQNYRVTLTNDSSLPADLRGQSVNFTIGSCGVVSPEMNPSMTVGEGQSVLVNLEYDLTNTVYYRTLSAGETVGSTCAEVTGGGGTRYQVCINPPSIGASFTVQ